jgi:hypothetical protein
MEERQEGGAQRSPQSGFRASRLSFERLVPTTRASAYAPPPTAASSAGCTPPQPKILEHHFLKTNTTNYDFLDNIGGVDSLLDIVGRGLKSRDAQFGYFRSSHPPDPS